MYLVKFKPLTVLAVEWKGNNQKEIYDLLKNKDKIMVILNALRNLYEAFLFFRIYSGRCTLNVQIAQNAFF